MISIKQCDEKLDEISGGNNWFWIWISTYLIAMISVMLNNIAYGAALGAISFVSLFVFLATYKPIKKDNLLAMPEKTKK